MAEVIGRYAPSPSGDLHFGSLVAAVASFCQARSRNGRWLLRIDDVDTPRVVAGAADRILGTLAHFGLRHDGPVMYQSARAPAYQAALEQLKASGDAFDCACTRHQARQGPMGPEGPIYPGTCRNGLAPGCPPRSVRCRVADVVIAIDDGIQGKIRQALAHDVGDFVIRRADGVTAYQLATVVDDAAQGVTEVVRGADLLMSSPRQRWLQRCLALPAVAYLHVPVILDADGEKLGKRHGALALDSARRDELLWQSLTLLGHRPPCASGARGCDWLLAWACEHWQAAAVPRKRGLPLGEYRTG